MRLLADQDSFFVDFTQIHLDTGRGVWDGAGSSAGGGARELMGARLGSDEVIDSYEWEINKMGISKFIIKLWGARKSGCLSAFICG
ncbi:MAG: hypothetical protein FIB07_01985 [Candidatus Methanoperedens sp.]|nr:hypothetical protein [Candidatus Methanoperedens sp.]